MPEVLYGVALLSSHDERGAWSLDARLLRKRTSVVRSSGILSMKTFWTVTPGQRLNTRRPPKGKHLITILIVEAQKNFSGEVGWLLASVLQTTDGQAKLHTWFCTKQTRHLFDICQTVWMYRGVIHFERIIPARGYWHAYYRPEVILEYAKPSTFAEDQDRALVLLMGWATSFELMVNTGFDLGRETWKANQTRDGWPRGRGR